MAALGQGRNFAVRQENREPELCAEFAALRRLVHLPCRRRYGMCCGVSKNRSSDRWIESLPQYVMSKVVELLHAKNKYFLKKIGLETGTDS
jgi:hypothetical protein